MVDQGDSTRVYWLLEDLCTQMGFSLAARQPERFEKLVSAGVDAFTDAVLVTEGLSLEEHKRLRSEVRASSPHDFGVGRVPNKRMNPTPKALRAFGTLAPLGAGYTQR
jgi:hypothetical protein